MATTTPAVQSAFYDAVVEQAQQTLGSLLGNVTPVALELAGQGQFPYNYQDQNLNFSIATWSWLNSVMVPGTSGGVAFSGTPFTNAYLDLLGKLGYALSSADQATMNQATINSQQQATNVVSQYEQIYGPITAAQLSQAKVTQKIDYVVGYTLNQWAGKNAPLQLNGGTLRNLASQLPAMPPSGRTLLLPIVAYLQQMISVLGLVNDSYNALTVLSDLQTNTSAPSSANGGIQTSDGATHAGWQVKEAMSAIDAALANAGASFTVTFQSTDYDATSTTVSVDGSGAGVIPIGDFLGIDIGGGVSYNMHDLNTDGQTFSVELTFTGVNLVDVAPTPYEADTHTGWYESSPIAEAVANHGKDVTGWKLDPWPQDTDFSQGGTFGLLNALIISQFPTVKISYAAGEASDYASELSEHVSVGIDLFGFRLGGVSQSYSHSVVNEHGKDGGFDITFTPAAPAGGALDQRAYVIAGSVTYPGA